ncbi:unknown [[Mannheimia] succiniciproducens MBEL55E]|uniref:Uncharacterized protein n=1 Tax=Mannheimia succiniciproducens (strain KCTC 0769BP / MBEL55E) TaxID=221988 RepID=Q65RC7_MANSM|nr:unknown [[Mannheimia] succiniciproducens MBEL55E]
MINSPKELFLKTTQMIRELEMLSIDLIHLLQDSYKSFI